MTADERDALETQEAPLYGDEEMVAASGVPLPSLRVLQAAGAIQSEKTPKHHGGFKRMWPERDVYKAAIASALGEQFSWNIRTVAEAMSKIHPSAWEVLITTALWEEDWREKTIVTASKFDCYLDLLDRKILFLRVPPITLALLPDSQMGQPDLLLGVAKDEGFLMLPWAFGSTHGRAKMKKALDAKEYQLAEHLYKLGMASRDNFLGKTTLNVSMQVRKAWHRLQGREAYFIQETIQFGKGGPDR